MVDSSDTVEMKKRWMEHFSEMLEGDRGEVDLVLEEREFEEGLSEVII